MNRRDSIYCKTCGITGCFQHCNHCFKEIKWRDEQGDARYDTNKNGKRIRVLFNPDGSIHKCMQGGTKDGKFYSVNREKQYYKLKDDIGTPMEGTTYWFYPLSDEELKQWRVDVRKYNYSQHHYMCIECAREFNKEIYPLCPSCWKMECRRCHARVPWRANKESYCVDCGNEKRDAVHVWRSMYRLYGKPTEI